MAFVIVPAGIGFTLINLREIESWGGASAFLSLA